jgi:DNA repair protein RadC
MPYQNAFPFIEDRFSGLTVKDLSKTEADSVIRLAVNMLEERHQPGQALCSPDETKAYLRLKLSDYRAEVFGVLFLDNRHRIIADEKLFQGTIDGANVHPRIVVQRALEVNAAAVLFYHNHPSGVAEPSNADRNITQRLTEALALVDIRVLDHFVVSTGESMSFIERGWL